MTEMSKTYSELIRLPTFVERYRYLKLGGVVGESTWGSKRYLNQALYVSDAWRHVRNSIILRDDGCDLGVPGYGIGGRIYIHHLNPITQEDIVKRRDWIMDPENLICVSARTHEAIHFGDERLLLEHMPVERTPGDTLLW